MNMTPAARLRAILDEVAEHETPKQVDLLPGILDRIAERQPAQHAAPRHQPQQARSAQSPRRRSRPALRMLVAPMLVLVLIVGLVVQLLQPQAVTAEEIVARIEQASATPDAFGLRSFHGHFVQTTQVAAHQSRVTSEYEIWYTAPDQIRIATQAHHPDGSSSAEVILSDGTTMWSYDPAQKQGRYNASPPFSQIFQIHSVGAFIAAMQQGAPSEQAVALLGTETVLGREAYVLEIQVNSDLVSKMKLWVDRQFYIPLQQETYDPHNPDFVERGAYTTFEVNGAIDPQLLSVPDDIQFEEEPAAATPLHPWADADAPFALFEPTYLPPVAAERFAWTGTESHLDRQPPEMIADYFLQGEVKREGEQVMAAMEHLFRMTITPTADTAICTAAELAMGGAEVQLGEFQGCSYTNPDPQEGQTLTIIRDGVRIKLNVDQWSLATPEELLQIGTSLVRVEQ